MMASKRHSKLNLYIIIYSHRHGTDVIPVLNHPSFPIPEITNELLAALGVVVPELERDDELASWAGPFDPNQLPIIKGGVLDWRPET